MSIKAGTLISAAAASLPTPNTPADRKGTSGLPERHFHVRVTRFTPRPTRQPVVSRRACSLARSLASPPLYVGLLFLRVTGRRRANQTGRLCEALAPPQSPEGNGGRARGGLPKESPPSPAPTRLMGGWRGGDPRPTESLVGCGIFKRNRIYYSRTLYARGVLSPLPDVSCSS